MKPIISNQEMFVSNLQLFLDKFLKRDDEGYISGFKSSLSKTLDKGCLVKKYEDFEYTYGYLRNMDFHYSIILDPETLYGFIFIQFNKVTIDGRGFFIYTDKVFKDCESFLLNNFQMENKQEFYLNYLRTYNIPRTIPHLFFTIFSKGLYRIVDKRSDTTMKLFTIFIFSKFFDFKEQADLVLVDEILEIKNNLTPILRSFEDISDMILSEHLFRKNPDKFLKKRISVENLIYLDLWAHI